ncbi:DUF1700 domain-containing protein [Bacillus sp. 1P06AnD]|uniref:DUF1700 domain-containing protein n=1 Tax=Bacillus sp. 1P06AnD TaxID=3132208 RepID=UPI0039A0A982
MNKQRYLDTLRKKLRKLPQDDIDEAIEYYSEYFDEAGPENEQDVINSLGTPSAVASKILADYAVKNMDSHPDSAKKGISAIWFIVLAILASPIALPIAIAAIALLFAVAVCGAAFIVSFFSVVAGLILGGIASIAAGIAVLFSHVPTALLFIGGGMAIAGIGLLLFHPLLFITKSISRSIARWMKRQFDKLSHTKKGGLNS